MSSTTIDLTVRPCPDHTDHHLTGRWKACTPCSAWAAKTAHCRSTFAMPEGHLNHRSQFEPTAARIRTLRPVKLLRSNGKTSTLRPGEYCAHAADSRHVSELQLLVPGYDPGGPELYWRRISGGAFVCEWVISCLPDSAVEVLGAWEGDR
ncbi:hypothetical protein [Cryptosporangium phraense]|uniref:Uncharacterized protein n=1 Tax=Cryptosporangium phraense TaxID=2593070 RepID=A0A545ASP1_9ACTN|nr:hypothetical protein [Cryptosporangium phraense]TQS44356.1 hypothetical protein FL583_15600 [Cryptosporangium phraense]